MPLNRDALLKKINSRKTFFIKALGDEVILRELSGKEVLDLTERHERGELSLADYTFSAIIASVVDENDEPVLDMELVQKLGVSVITELTDAVGEYNGLKVQLEKAKADLKKVRQNAS